jgi:hypothetical protein
MIRIYPWISENYRNNTSKFDRLLILCESHYDKNREFDPNFTIDVVQDVIDGTRCKGYRYYTILGNIFNQEDRSDLFLNCAFANLIQEVLEKPRVHPTAEELATIQDAFWDILRLTKPKKVIVTSQRAWNYWLPDNDPRGRKIAEIKENDRYSTVWKYEFEDVSCEAIGIGHPSGKNFYSWEGLVNSFLKSKG